MRRALALALTAAALAGCTLEPAYVRPTPTTPATWPVGAAYPPPVPGAAQAPSYREAFRDPHLQALIARALASNQDLAAALANVEIARSQYQVTRSGLLPKLGAEIGGSEAQTNPQVFNPDGTTTRRRQIVRAKGVFQFGERAEREHQPAPRAANFGFDFAAMSVGHDGSFLSSRPRREAPRAGTQYSAAYR